MKKLRAKNSRETNALQIIERKDQTISMNHNADLQIALHVVLISTEQFRVISRLHYLKLNNFHITRGR